MNSETALDLVKLLTDPSENIRKESLMLLLQFSDDGNTRKVFLTLGLIKQIVSMLETDAFTNVVLSIIIQFSQDDEFILQLIQNNAVYRISQLINEITLGVLKSQQSYSEAQLLVVQLGLLSLSNITQIEEGKLKFLQLDSDKIHQCFYLRMFINFYIDERTSDFFGHFSQVLLNLSSNEDCRKFILRPEYKMFSVLKQLLKKPGALVIHILKNLIFEYENEEIQEQIASSYIVDGIAQFLLDTILKEKNLLVPAETQMQQLQVDEQVEKKIEESLQKIQGAIKCLLILTNIITSDKKLPYSYELISQSIIELKKVQYLDSTDRDQIEVIETCFQAQ